jgi:hypothetical protein
MHWGAKCLSSPHSHNLRIHISQPVRNICVLFSSHYEASSRYATIIHHALAKSSHRSLVEEFTFRKARDVKLTVTHTAL